MRSSDENGWQLPEEYYRVSDPSCYAWSLPSCIHWIDGSEIMHEESNTLKGGPYGFKWIVVLLVHLYSSLLKVKSNRGPNYGDDIDVEWRRSDQRAIEAVCDRLITRVRDSARILLMSRDARLKRGTDDDVALASHERWQPNEVEHVAEPMSEDEWLVRTSWGTYWDIVWYRKLMAF